jgi:hypothetical protein
MESMGACRFSAPSVLPTQVATTQLGVYAMYHASTKLSVVPDFPAVVQR